MAMTVLVTRDVPMRSRGFLASCMLEIAPGIYTSPRMSKAVRERVWAVLSDWHEASGQGSVVLTWAEPKAAGGQAIRSLGTPATEIVEYDACFIVRRAAVSGEDSLAAPGNHP